MDVLVFQFQKSYLHLTGDENRQISDENKKILEREVVERELKTLTSRILYVRYYFKVRKKSRKKSLIKSFHELHATLNTVKVHFVVIGKRFASAFQQK